MLRRKAYNIDALPPISEETRAKIVEAQWMYGMKGEHGLDVVAPWLLYDSNDSARRTVSPLSRERKRQDR
jgi:hypothetical protein